MATTPDRSHDPRGLSRRELLRSGAATLTAMTVGRYIKLPRAHAVAPSPVIAQAQEYGVDDIQVLEDGDAVRMRPGMYVGGTGTSAVHHLVYEVLGNAIDEAMAGFGKTIIVELLADGSCRVSDEGRGIPIEASLIPAYGAGRAKRRPGIEIILSTLHGGCFLHGWNPATYWKARSFHGVGVCCVNFLSEYFVAEVARDGNVHRIEFCSGRLAKPLHIVHPAEPSARTGTVITFKPDATIFPDPQFMYETLAARLRELSFLHSDITIRLIDERIAGSTGPRAETFHATNGLADYVKFLSNGRPVVGSFMRATHADTTGRCEVAFQFCDDDNEAVVTFANGGNTIGGTHATAFRRSVRRSLLRHAGLNGLIPRSRRSTRGAKRGIVALVSLWLPSPCYGGATKEKIVNPEAAALTSKATSSAVETWFRDHFDEAKCLCDSVFPHANIP